MSAPNSEERRACWRARDEFWKCLDLSQEDVTTCEKYKKEFEELCPAQWVKYFNKRRDYLKYKDKIEKEGYRPSAEAPKF